MTGECAEVPVRYTHAAQKKDFDRASDQLRQAVASDPTFGQAYFNLALIDEKRKEYKKATQEYLDYLALDPQALDGAAVREKIRRLQK